MTARNTDLAKIHIAAKDLGWSRQHYEDELWSVCRVRSAGKLDAYGRKNFLDHMKSLGWNPRGKNNKSKGRPHNFDRSNQLQKIEALLADAGRAWSYADGLAQKLTKPSKQRLAFCDGAELKKVLVALELDAQRRLQRQIQKLLAYLGEDWGLAQNIAVRDGYSTDQADVTKDARALSHVRSVLNDMAQAACPL